MPDREDVGHEACLSSETLSSRGDRASLVTGHLCGTGGGQGAGYSIAERETSLTRNTPLLGPYRRTIPRVLWWSWGRGAVSFERGTPVAPKPETGGGQGAGRGVGAREPADGSTSS